MSATGIKFTKSVQNTRVSNAAAEDDEEVCNNATNNTTDIAQCDAVFNEENSSSFSHLPSLKEQSASGDYYAENDALRQNTKVPLATNTGSTHDDAEDDERSIVASQGVDQFNNDPQINSHGAESSQLSPGLSLLQQAAATSSPPPHSYRHSRAYRHFKNPPQPHMCIRTTSETGEELFINVLSWTRIVIPQEPSDPIPLYGGMRVPPGSPRSPPIVFAVMANPEVLKDSGRHSKDPEERRAMVELMCDFVEAMNPGVKLIRNAVILKDRDISGELKDVWNAVQAQRDREREEQMLQQRQQQQQQHYHNLTNGALNANAAQQMFPKSILGGEGTPPRTRKMLQEDVTNEDGINNTSNNDGNEMTMMMNTATMSLEQLAEQLDNKMSMQQEEGRGQVVAGEQRDDERLTNKTMSNGNDCKDSLDGNRQQQQEVINQLNANITTTKDLHNNKPGLTNGAMVNINCNITITNTVPEGAALELKTTTMPVLPTTVNTQQNHTTTNSPATTPAAAATPTPTPPTKKEKLGGFLPNGCIFPRFTKNNKHKDKDKEGKTKDKEKNVLLSALKKSKDKKSNNAAATAAAAAAAAASNAIANQDDKLQQLEQNVNITTTTSSSSSTTTTNTAKQQKNCLQQLECGVQKLDLNHIDKTTTPANNTSTNNSTNTTNSSSNSTGVGVH